MIHLLICLLFIKTIYRRFTLQHIILINFTQHSLYVCNVNSQFKHNLNNLCSLKLHFVFILHSPKQVSIQLANGLKYSLLCVQNLITFSFADISAIYLAFSMLLLQISVVYYICIFQIRQFVSLRRWPVMSCVPLCPEVSRL